MESKPGTQTNPAIPLHVRPGRRLAYSPYPGFLLWALLAAVLTGCAISQHRDIDQTARASGFERRVVQGKRFQHVIWLNRPARPGDVLHVYLEGDGSPWIRQVWVASDPTPERPLMLRLMRMDDVRSVYLGRPCYFGLAKQPVCEARYWTGARYSEAVVASLQQALQRIIDETGAGELVFMGHSGGGTLAMLLAERFPQTRALVTLAGNLDIDGWTELHGWLPLHESLNPATREPLSPAIYQLHLAGSDDRAIPPALIEAVVARQPGARLVVIPGFSHTCCWERIWPDVLRARIPSAPRP